MLTHLTPGYPVFSKKPTMLVLSDYAKGALNRVEELINQARNAGVKVLVDPKGNDFSRYRGATLLTPNIAEFELVAGPCPTEEIWWKKAVSW